MDMKSYKIIVYELDSRDQKFHPVMDMRYVLKRLTRSLNSEENVFTPFDSNNIPVKVNRTIVSCDKSAKLSEEFQHSMNLGILALDVTDYGPRMDVGTLERVFSKQLKSSNRKRSADEADEADAEGKTTKKTKTSQCN